MIGQHLKSISNLWQLHVVWGLGLWSLGGFKGKLLISTFWQLHMYSVVQWGAWSVVSGWNQRQTSHLHLLVHYMYGVVQCGEFGLWSLGGIKHKLLISTCWQLHVCCGVVQWGEFGLWSLGGIKGKLLISIWEQFHECSTLQYCMQNWISYLLVGPFFL